MKRYVTYCVVIFVILTGAIASAINENLEGRTVPTTPSDTGLKKERLRAINIEVLFDYSNKADMNSGIDALVKETRKYIRENASPGLEPRVRLFSIYGGARMNVWFERTDERVTLSDPIQQLRQKQRSEK